MHGALIHTPATDEGHTRRELTLQGHNTPPHHIKGMNIGQIGHHHKRD